MSADVRIPTLGESVTEGVIVRWIKSDGELVETDEPLLELETEKASVEIPAPARGVLKVLKGEGSKVQVDEVVARLEDGGREAAARPAAPAQQKPAEEQKEEQPRADEGRPQREDLSPAVRRLVEEHGLDPGAMRGSGRGGRLTKNDVLAHLEEKEAQPAPEPAPEKPAAAPEREPTPAPAAAPPEPAAVPRGRGEERVPMSALRQRIAQRLVEAQRTAAILTTFNEVDMSAVMELRAKYKARFAEVHGVDLGFMSFFARACVAALREMPIVNAQIEGTEIVYRENVNLGIAVATPRGLIVPVVRNAQLLSFAGIEKEIDRLAGLAGENKLAIEDLSGGTFTITNGGVFGSLLSTPILNPPQSAILGMHKIEKRPVVVQDQIVIRPMMYLAVSYDHRIIDGADAVRFLVRIKERIEDPDRLLLDV